MGGSLGTSGCVRLVHKSVIETGGSVFRKIGCPKFLFVVIFEDIRFELCLIHLGSKADPLKRLLQIGKRVY